MSAPASIATVTDRNSVRFDNLLYATDFSESSLTALPFVQAIARKLGSSVFVCHIITPTPLAVGAPEAAPYLYQAERDNAEKEMAALVTSRELRDLKTTSLMPSGILAEEIETAIRDNKIDLVIAGTHGRTGMRRLLLGSAVEEICRVAACPVLTVGPELSFRENIELKHILLPSDLSEESLRSLPYVAQLARAYDSAVTVLHVMPEDAATNPDAKVLSEPVRRQMVHLFEPQLAGLKTEYVIEFGDAVETVLTRARRTKADLIGMGIRSAFLPGFQLHSSFAYRVISGAHCPVLTCR